MSRIKKIKKLEREAMRYCAYCDKEAVSVCKTCGYPVCIDCQDKRGDCVECQEFFSIKK